MELSFLTILGAGFILGIKHAIEPDHVIAVSTIASQSRNLWRSSLAGLYWGIGHTATLFVVGMFLLLMKGQMSTKVTLTLELFVGLMLLYLGISTLISLAKRTHRHQHQNHHNNVSYIKSLIIGFIHGLAGSAAMVLLTMSTVNTILEGGLYILVFGTGTIIGMLMFTTFIGIPFVLSEKKLSAHAALIGLTGMISTIFGVYYMYNLVVNEGLIRMWIE